jgi:NitT/TauT family transport system substrate-binding protein
MDGEALRYDRRAFLRRAGASAVLVPAAGGGLSLLVSGCGSGGEQPQGGGGSGGGALTKQTFTTPLGFIFSFVEAYVAAQQGFWSREGLDVTVRGGQGTATALQAVLGRSAQYSRAGGISTIVAVANQGSPLVNVGTIFQRSQFELASLPAAPITTPEQMRGKRIGVVSSGGATENLVQIMAANRGVPFDSIKRPVVGVGAAAYQLARQGKIDGWVALDTDLAVLRTSAGADIVSFNTDKFGFVPSDAYVVARDQLQRSRDAVKRFLAGLLRAVEFGIDQANWDKVIAAAKHYDPSLDEEQARLQLPILVADWTAAGRGRLLDLIPGRWQEGVENLQRAGLIQQAVPVDRLIEPSLLQEVKGA